MTVSPTADTAKQALPIIGTIVSSLWGRDEREDVEVLKAKIENYKRSMANAPSMGFAVPFISKEYYQNEINKLQGLLKASKELAAEERQSAQLYTWGRAGIVVGIFVGVAVIGGVAINQMQKARLAQVQIKRLRAEVKT